jgi:hypothetical protein
MQPVQALALSVSLFHIALLAGVYISEGGAQTETFVSAPLDSNIYFKVLFSITVVVEIIIASVYIFQSAPPSLHTPWASLAGLSLLTALASWIVVASSHSGSPWHFNGAGVFVVSSFMYSCFLVDRARRYKWLYALILITDGSCAAAFTILLLQEKWHSSAVLEWVTIFLQGTMFAIYYYETPICEGAVAGVRQQHKQMAGLMQQHKQMASGARPVRGNPFSMHQQQQMAEADTRCAEVCCVSL